MQISPAGVHSRSTILRTRSAAAGSEIGREPELIDSTAAPTAGLTTVVSRPRTCCAHGWRTGRPRPLRAGEVVGDDLYLRRHLLLRHPRAAEARRGRGTQERKTVRDRDRSCLATTIPARRSPPPLRSSASLRLCGQEHAVVYQAATGAAARPPSSRDNRSRMLTWLALPVQAMSCAVP